MMTWVAMFTFGKRRSLIWAPGRPGASGRPSPGAPRAPAAGMFAHAGRNRGRQQSLNPQLAPRTEARRGPAVRGERAGYSPPRHELRGAPSDRGGGNEPDGLVGIECVAQRRAGRARRQAPRPIWSSREPGAATADWLCRGRDRRVIS